MINQRTYKLEICPNFGKLEATRYTYTAFLMWCEYWAGRLFFNTGKIPSTAGMGEISNRAQRKVWGVIKTLRATSDATGGKTNVPKTNNLGMFAKIDGAKNGSFDYWIKVRNLWASGKPIKIPAKSHKALNKALKNGWKLSENCEVKQFRGRWEVLVFASKEAEKAQATTACIGADVGINKAATFSNGYKGTDLRPVIKRAKESQQERHRQRMKFGQIQKLKGNKNKSVVKQILDREANELVRSSKQLGCNIVVESRKILANLRCGRLNRWARCYFANRLEVLCKESSIFFLEVNPWNSSKTCSHCREIGKRDGEEFVCQNSSCPEYLMKADADINAAKVLKDRGRTVLEKYFSKTISSA